MRQQLSNSIYGMLDYAAYPVGMLIVAPFILRNLGVAQYGIWTVTTSLVNVGSIVASGFGDANTQKIGYQRSGTSGDSGARTVRAAMGIHVTLGLAAGFAIWSMAGFLAGRLVRNDAALRDSCVWSIRLAAVLTAIRAIETICISTQKAYERYGVAVRISVAGRLLSLAAAALLAVRADGVATIIFASVALTAVGLGIQLIGLQRLLGTRHIAPAYEGRISKDLLRFGAFTWMLAATGVVFGQADRLIGGASLGAAAIVAYALCAQLSQPVYGLTAAGLHFLFPYIASRHTRLHGTVLRKTVLLAVFANVVMALSGAGLLLVSSGRLLRVLAPDELARRSADLLPAVLAGSMLLALSVTGSYTMIALGRVRTVALLNLVACGVIVAFTVGSLRSLGIMAIAGGRIAFALVALCVYIPLTRELRWRTPQVEQFAPSEAVEGI